MYSASNLRKSMKNVDVKEWIHENTSVTKEEKYARLIDIINTTCTMHENGEIKNYTVSNNRMVTLHSRKFR